MGHTEYIYNIYRLLKNYKLTIDVLFAIIISCFIFKLVVKVLYSKFDFNFLGIVAEMSKNVSTKKYYCVKFQIRDFEILVTILASRFTNNMNCNLHGIMQMK